MEASTAPLEAHLSKFVASHFTTVGDNVFFDLYTIAITALVQYPKCVLASK